jgi:tRNA-2-methylthio-N6-dimethylallyladenosine synthase
VDLKNDVDLADLLKEVAKINGVYQIRFGESHPSYMTEKLLDTVANIDKILPVFVLGLQSGNDEILAKMKRGYTSSKYREVIRRVRLKIPDAFIMTHVIVGFPGESHEQFMETYNLLKEIQPKVIFPHMYSSRPGTLAAKIMTDSVPSAEKKFRMLMLKRLCSNYIDPKNRRVKERRLKK